MKSFLCNDATRQPYSFVNVCFQLQSIRGGGVPTQTGGGLGGPLAAGLTRGTVVSDQPVPLVTHKLYGVGVGEVYPGDAPVLHRVRESTFNRWKNVNRGNV